MGYLVDSADSVWAFHHLGDLEDISVTLTRFIMSGTIILTIPGHLAKKPEILQGRGKEGTERQDHLNSK